MPRRRIDVEAAKRWRARGFGYRHIGEQLAKADGRGIRYTAEAVSKAIARRARETQK